MSSAVATYKASYYDELNEVVTLYLKGKRATEIAKMTGMRRADVLERIEEWRTIAQNDDTVKARSREALVAMTLHYDQIISEFWDVANNTGDEKNKLTALKHIADIEAVRQKTLQQAGMYDDAVLGDEVAKAEEQIQQIKQLLLKVVDDFPATKADILAGLSKIFGEGVGVDAPVQPEIIAYDE